MSFPGFHSELSAAVGPLLPDNSTTIKLPQPSQNGSVSIEEVLQLRRSRRAFRDQPLSLTQVSQLLWAAQGITDQRGYRTAPSAGALYPLELYVMSGNVTGLNDGLYHYIPGSQQLVFQLPGDKRAQIAQAALNQNWMAQAPAIIIVTADFERTSSKYGSRGDRYVYFEAGAAAENIYLQATGLKLGTTVVGAFHDDQIKQILLLPKDRQPICLMPVGIPDTK